MDKQEAQELAVAMLNTVLQNQPNLMQFSNPSGYGETAAQFCIDFVTTYSAWLTEQK